jgi:RNA polymerase sigma-70 factor (ECF subfamily)
MSHQLDTQAIAAVRTGEVDRFRELVERYERHVYAVAWARLGDATLAEDATQEAFIRAYRLLGWLKDPARFAGWITRITRAVAINLGLRHRRELRRRERWALDPANSDGSTNNVTTPSTPEPGDLPVTPDTLRTALADLPTRHRECLVLFYLEGKTIAEAATLLNLSEGAFKVRLHRARKALRGRLEQHLESSLGRLAPRRSLVPGIMSSILLKSAASDPTGTSAGVLAILGASLAKFLPLPLFFFLVPVAAVTVGVGANFWVQRIERENYRDTEGFRRRLYDDDRVRVRNHGAGTALLLVLFMVAMVANPGLDKWYLAMGAVALVVSLVFALRQSLLTSRVASLARWVAAVPLIASFLLSTVYEMPLWIQPAAFALSCLGMMFYPSERPLRFDHNLFLRDRLGMMPTVLNQATGSEPPSYTPKQLWAFAQFGGRRGLFTAYHRLAQGVRLKLRPVSVNPRDWFWPWISRRDSTLTLLTDGTVEASLGSSDRHHLERLGIASCQEETLHRKSVEAAVQAALKAHASGDEASALRRLGHASDLDIFQVEPARTGFPRAQRWSGALGLLLMGCVVVPIALRMGNQNLAFRTAHLQPVPYSLEDARAIVGAFGNGATAYSRKRWADFESTFYHGYRLPPLEWASREGQAFLRTNFVSMTVSDATQNPVRAMAFLSDWRIPKAVLSGWAPSNTVAEFQAAGPTFRNLLAAVPTGERQRLLKPDITPQRNSDRSGLELSSLRPRIAVLKKLGVLDLFDTKPLISLLLDHQVLPGKPLPPDRQPLLHPRPWQGLFRTRGVDPIGETYEVLFLLEHLGALERIDHAACAEGILRLHLGKGLFLTPQGWDRPFARRPRRDEPTDKIYIPGDARTTYAARESLGMLGALDRVPDLAEWEYRIHTTSVPPDLAQAHRGPGAWSRVEAVLLREAAATD